MPVRKQYCSRDNQKSVVAFKPTEIQKPSVDPAYQTLCDQLANISPEELIAVEQQLEQFAATGSVGTQLEKFIKILETPNAATSRAA